MTFRNSALRMLTLVTLCASCSGGDKAQLPPMSQEKSEGKQGEKKKIAEKTGAKPTETLESFFRLSGQVSSEDKIFLSFRVSANINKITVKPGTKVKKGDVLAELYDVVYRLRDATAKLELEKANNALEQAKRDFNIEKELREKDISSPVQFQNGELAYKNAVVTQKLAQLNMLSAKTNFENTKLVAPQDGTISQQYKFAGDLSTGGEAGGATFEMYVSKDPEVYLSAPESLLSRIAIGDKLDLKFAAINLTLPGEIIRVVPAIRENNRTFLVVAKPLKLSAQIVPGLFAEGIIKESRK